ncbi:hypothetical protein IC230_27635 [Spirosoma sp. BT704]|uniref:Uncharacterized protein n=2 Tax=Spirosoma validum TaxID=2771355 RepID=A0A927GGJ8_9BACT|nr:hypothetical protein [Spirosoma validum]
MPSTAVLLNAGPVQVRYENGFLRTLSMGNRELVRMIYFALRNPDWSTARIDITNERIDQTYDTFHVDYNWLVNDLGIHMAGHVAMQGHSDGRIAVVFQGEALSTFQRNRIGICVLHPLIGTTGQPCQITSPDGSQSNGLFPELIRPNQPFLGIQSMTWQTAFGDTLQLEFAGDVFETEDQRNWTDASFKTYSTPLTIPIPATVPAGTIVEQRVHFQPISLADETASAPIAPVASEQPENTLRIGLGQRADGQRLRDTEIASLKKLVLSHLRADVFLSSPDWTDHLQNARSDAQALGIPLDLALFFSTDSAKELSDFLAFLETNPTTIQSVSLFNLANRITSDTLLTKLVPILRAQLPTVPIGGGTDANFAEFNRNRFTYDLVDFVTFSINPQVHAFDNQTIMENVAAQADVVRSARYLTNNKPVRISAVTLLPRFNPALSTTFPIPLPLTDPRQSTHFAADWTKASRQILQGAGAVSVTYFETHGPRGIVDDETVFPVFNSLL